MKIFKRFANIFQVTTIAIATLPVAIILLGVQGVQAATPGFVQVKATKINSGTTNNATFSQPNGAGNLIVVHVLWGNAGNVTLTDTKNNVYTPVAPATRFSNNQASSQVFYAKNIAGAAANGNTVKATFATSINNWAMVYAHEYSGVDKVNPVDVFGTTTGTGTAMSASLTTHQSNSLIFGAAIAQDSHVTSVGAGFQVRSTLSQDWTMDKVLPAAGTTTVTANRSGNGGWVLQAVAFKADSGDTSAPSVPLNLVASAVSGTQANLSWNASTDNIGVAGYRVFRDGSEIATVGITSYQDSGRTPGVTYSYTVSAFDAAGNTSAQSSPASVTMPIPPDNTPPTVALVSPAEGAVVAGAINVIANATDNVVVNRVEFRVDGVLVATDTTALGNAYSFVLDTTTLTNDVHAFTATAFDATGNNASSSANSIVDNQAPTTPTNFVANVVSHSQIDLSWDLSSDNRSVDHYKLFRNGSQVGGMLTGTSYSDTGLAGQTTYNYEVKAFDAAGNSSAPASASATTPTAPDVTPAVLLNGQPSGSQPSGTTTATLSVDTNEAATCRYATVAGTAYDAMPVGSFTTTGGTTHSAALSGLVDGQSYSYFVRCKDVANNVNTADYAINFSISEPSTNFVFPLRAHASGRYLVDQNNRPFLMVGDSPQGIVGSLSLAESESYFANRELKGFNTVWINLLAMGTTGGTDNGATPDGILPFTAYLPGHNGDPKYYDLSTPNNNYFSHATNPACAGHMQEPQCIGRADSMIAQAGQHNIMVILDPIETMDWLEVVRHNCSTDTTKCLNYGRYLGDSFKNHPNIIYMHGNDYTPTTSDNTMLMEVAKGISQTDLSTRLQTVEIYPTPVASYDNPAWLPYIDLDLVYMYSPAFQKVLGEYNRSSDPVIMIESHYDFEELANNPHQPDYSYRKQEFWTMLSGGTGYVYGNYYTVYFSAGWDTDAHLNTPAVAQLGYLKTLFNSVAWYNLVPDQSHTFVTAGLGSSDGGFQTNDYLTAALTPDGTLGMAYLPTGRVVTVNMTKMSGATTTRWFNPTNNAFTTIGTFPNTGSRQFTPPSGPHPDGTTDWVLVLETAPPVPDTQPPSVPLNLSASAVSSSQINLAWTASTDNVGVTGYKIFRDGVQIGTSATNSFQNTGLAASTTYSYTVSAFDNASNSSVQSSASSATTQTPPPPDTIPPSTPTNLTAGTVTQTQASLSWIASTDTPPGVMAGYHIFRCQGAGCTPAQITSSLVTSTSFIDSTLAPATTYVYLVKAVDGAGNVSPASNQLTVTTQTPPQPGTALMGAWGFNENTGTLAADASGNNNTATLSSSFWAPGKYGSGVSLNGQGSGNNLAIANSPSLNISGNEMTISLWLKPESPFSSDTTILGKFWNASWSDPYYQYGVELSGGNRPSLVLGTTSGYQVASMSQTLAYGQWNHLGITFSSGQVKFYLNGTLVNTQTITGSITARGNPMNISADQSNGQNFRGVLDEIHIYNKALTQTEIQTDMNPL